MKVNCGGRWGKTHLMKIEVEKMLDAGKRVLIASPSGWVIKKRRGRLTLITPLKQLSSEWRPV